MTHSIPSKNALSTTTTNPFVDLYKFYLELTLRINAYYLTIVGVILSFGTDLNRPDFFRYLLLLPAAMSFFQVLIYVASTGLARQLHKQHRKYLLSAINKCDHRSHYLSYNPLFWMLISFAVVHLLLMFLLASIFFHAPWLAVK